MFACGAGCSSLIEHARVFKHDKQQPTTQVALGAAAVAGEGVAEAARYHEPYDLHAISQTARVTITIALVRGYVDDTK